MTINELIEELQALQEDHGDCEVRLATQPSWPFEYSISDVVFEKIGGKDMEVLDADELAELDENEREQYEADLAEDEEKSEHIVYLAEGRQIGYLPGVVSKSLGWRG
jgi:hypothetical protein